MNPETFRKSPLAMLAAQRLGWKTPEKQFADLIRRMQELRQALKGKEHPGSREAVINQHARQLLLDYGYTETDVFNYQKAPDKMSNEVSLLMQCFWYLDGGEGVEGKEQ